LPADSYLHPRLPVRDNAAAADAGHRNDGRIGGAAMTLPFARDPEEPFTFGDLDAMPVDGRRWSSPKMLIPTRAAPSRY
jgi:hypothetical protein